MIGFIDLMSREVLVSALAATAACSAVVVVSWPYLQSDGLDGRLRRVADEREQMRQRERRRLDTDVISAVRRPPNPLLNRLVEGLNLSRALSDGKIAAMLATAGLRGNAALITYLAARILAPAVLYCVVMFYIFMVVDLAQPTIVKMMIALAAGALGFFLPSVYVKNKITKRQQGMERAWPDALDLLLICVEAGMSIDPALQKVAHEIGAQSADLAEELSLTNAELSFLPSRRQAYENLANRTGIDSVKAVVASLKQAEKHGTSLGKSLRVLAQENRTMRLMMAEQKAAALPPKLTVPMILFFLPVLFVVIITPAAIQISAS